MDESLPEPTDEPAVQPEAAVMCQQSLVAGLAAAMNPTMQAIEMLDTICGLLEAMTSHMRCLESHKARLEIETDLCTIETALRTPSWHFLTNQMSKPDPSADSACGSSAL